MLGLYCCLGFSVVAESGGYSLAVVRGLFIAVASLVAKPRLWSTGSVAPRHAGPFGVGTEPVSPSLSGGSFTTEPPGQPCDFFACFRIH